jgi:nicotinamide mononucleotide transporter
LKNRVSKVALQAKLLIAAAILIGTTLMGFLFNNIHLYLPEYFKVQASYPFIDSFVLTASIIATILLAKKKIETWHLWICIDIICVCLYFKKATYFLSIEYLIFLGLALYGLFNWKKQLNND